MAADYNIAQDDYTK